jgi:serine/threonine protein kinase/TolB-like protein/Tfp pilus assembly protein PilF
MDPQHHARRVAQLFEAAVDLEPLERDAHLAEACRGDPGLRREIEALLALHDSAGTDTDLFPPLFSDVAASLTGERLGPYLIRELISEGGMGVVYLAEREDVGKRVAVKLVREGRLASATQMQRFLRERRVLARMEHPNIARLLDAGWTQQRVPYLVMEYVEGTPITEFCDEHRLPIDARIRLFQRVCEAVEHAHRNRVVHRDLKPVNILVTPEGEVKLLDFGIAKLFADEGAEAGALTRSGMLLATPEYASPEQIRGQEITPASDVYSLGVVLYELLSGHRPYHLTARTPAEVERVICATDPGRPSTVVMRTRAVVYASGSSRRVTPREVSGYRSTRPDRLRRQLSGDLDTVVLKALAKEPERRYPSVQELKEDLERHLQGLPVHARVDSLAYRAGKFVRQHAPELVLPGALLLSLLAALAVLPGLFYLGLPVWAAALWFGFALLGLSLSLLVVGRSGLAALALRPATVATVPSEMAGAARERPSAEQASVRAVQLPQPIRSIAVLPFADLSPAKDHEYLADGVTEELLNVLAHIPGLHVPARTSSFAFKGKNVDIREIGWKLDVETVLEGSVRRGENEILITAQLISVEDGYHLWSEKYRREPSDLLLLQEEISRAIVSDLRLRFEDAGYPMRIAPAAGDPEAYTLYLKARYLHHQGSGESVRKALAFFEKALERDPGYAAAHAGLGDAYMNLGYFGHLPREEAYPLAKQAVARALELDPTLAEAHAAFAWIALRADWDFAAAERAYRRALALKPGYATVHQGYALFLAYLGRLEEALAEARRAVELDPLSVAASNVLGAIYFYTGQPEEGVRQFQASLDLDPSRTPLLCNLALAHSFAGNHEEAISLAIRGRDLSGGNVWALGALCYAYAVAGRHAEAEELLQRLEEEARQGRMSPCFVAVVHVGLNQHDQALDWLDLAYERRDDLLLVLNVDPIYRPLRSDPRFAVLLRRVGLDPVAPSPLPAA